MFYVALVCREDELERRLRARPAWRGWDDAKIRRMLEFNQWLLANAQETTPPIALLDTTNDPVEETVRSVVAWVRSRDAGCAAGGASAQSSA